MPGTCTAIRMNATVADMSAMSELAIQRSHVDTTYRGYSHPNWFQVYLSSQAKRTTAAPGRQMKRRAAIERAISLRTAGVVRACGWMDSITSSCGEELGVAGRQSAKYVPQFPNAPDSNNVPVPNSEWQSDLTSHFCSDGWRRFNVLSS
jgi:hypothetical protein